VRTDSDFKTGGITNEKPSKAADGLVQDPISGPCLKTCKTTTSYCTVFELVPLQSKIPHLDDV
jgi:hypothetical protein